MAIQVVVPSYRLVWYNPAIVICFCTSVVVPSYRLVWYNRERKIPVFIMFTGIFHVKKDGKSFFFVSKIILFSKNIYQIRGFVHIVKCRCSKKNINRFVLLFRHYKTSYRTFLR